MTTDYKAARPSCSIRLTVGNKIPGWNQFGLPDAYNLPQPVERIQCGQRIYDEKAEMPTPIANSAASSTIFITVAGGKSVLRG